MNNVHRALAHGTIATTLLLCITSGTLAQGPVRGGFWLEGAMGTGTVRNTCAGCDDVTVAYGAADYVRVGGSLSARVFLGVEIFALNTSEMVLRQGAAPVEAENGSIAPIVIWYVGRSGFFLKAGAGLARGTFLVRTADGEALTTKKSGSSLTFGIGYDIGVMRWLALTANLGTYVTAIGDVDVDGTIVDDVIATVYEGAIGVTLR